MSKPTDKGDDTPEPPHTDPFMIRKIAVNPGFRESEPPSHHLKGIGSKRASYPQDRMNRIFVILALAIVIVIVVGLEIKQRLDAAAEPIQPVTNTEQAR